MSIDHAQPGTRLEIQRALGNGQFERCGGVYYVGSKSGWNSEAALRHDLAEMREDFPTIRFRVKAETVTYMDAAQYLESEAAHA